MSPCNNWLSEILLFHLIISTTQSIQYHDDTLTINSLPFELPVYVYGGVSGLYNNTIIAHSSYFCNITATCPSYDGIDSFQYSLDISSLQLNTINNTISFPSNPSWILQHIEFPPPENTTIDLPSFTQTTGYTQLNKYTYSMHYGRTPPGTDTLLIYDLSLSEYIDPISYPFQVPNGEYYGACNTNDGSRYIYSIGGQEASSTRINAVIRYDTQNEVFEIIDSLIEVRSRCSCTFVLDKLYALGGNNNGKLGSIEEYDPSLNQWSLLSVSLITPRNTHMSITHPNNWIITIGGRDGSSNPAPIEITDVINGYTSTTNCSYPRKEFLTVNFNYDQSTKIVFFIGGFISGIKYNDVQYMVLSTDDTFFPTNVPTNIPTYNLSDPPSTVTSHPSIAPTIEPTFVPSVNPTSPTLEPTVHPTSTSTAPTNVPTQPESIIVKPTPKPTAGLHTVLHLDTSSLCFTQLCMCTKHVSNTQFHTTE